MRNITFDESTVMREFARLMNEKMVKTAAQTNPFVIETNRLNDLSAKLMQKHKGNIVAAKKELDIEIKKSVDKLTKMYGKTNPQVIEQFKKNVSTLLMPEQMTDTPVDVEMPKSEKVSEKELLAKELNMKINRVLSKYPNVKAVFEGRKAEPIKVFKEMAGKLFVELSFELGGNYQDASKHVLSKLEKYWQPLMPRLNPNDKQRVIKILQDAKFQKPHSGVELTALPNLLNFANKNISKRSELLYNITKETGKDLINDAHPKNTKTDVDVKTKENIVETVVEQQKKDLEVALKQPKGTYAKLVDLYNEVYKTGNKKAIVEIGDLLRKTATAEDIVKHTLMTLGNELDKIGAIKAANEVDIIMKKIAEKPEFGGPSVYYGGKWHNPQTPIQQTPVTPTSGTKEMNELYESWAGPRQMTQQRGPEEIEDAEKKLKEAPKQKYKWDAKKQVWWQKEYNKILNKLQMPASFVRLNETKPDFKSPAFLEAKRYWTAAKYNWKQLEQILLKEKERQMLMPETQQPTAQSVTQHPLNFNELAQNLMSRLGRGYNERVELKYNKRKLSNYPELQKHFKELANSTAKAIIAGQMTEEQANQKIEKILRQYEAWARIGVKEGL